MCKQKWQCACAKGLLTPSRSRMWPSYTCVKFASMMHAIYWLPLEQNSRGCVYAKGFALTGILYASEVLILGPYTKSASTKAVGVKSRRLLYLGLEHSVFSMHWQDVDASAAALRLQRSNYSTVPAAAHAHNRFRPKRDSSEDDS